MSLLQDGVRKELEKYVQSGAYAETLTGSYVTPDIGATLDDLGVPPPPAAEKTHFALFEVTAPTSCSKPSPPRSVGPAEAQDNTSSNI